MLIKQFRVLRGLSFAPAIWPSRITLNVKFAVLLLVILGFQSRTLMAQVDQGTITGVVQDTTGAVIPGATVTVVNTDNGLTRKGVSDAAGYFNFSPLKIGNYEIKVAAPGFEGFDQEHLHLDVSQRLNVPVALKAGQVTDTVTVTDAPPLLQTEESSVGQVISTKAINETPLNGRNWVYIAQLTAGAAPAFSATRGGGTGDFFSNGQRAEQNNFILDGVDNNTNLIDFLNGASYVVRPPPDALAEFKIETGNYSAEYGHSAGAVINASVKTGTNQIHGNLWEYVRNTDLDARSWNSTSVPPYHENQFGGTIGLPLLKNKLFYFGDVEANRITISQPQTYTVPTTLERSGNFTELLNPALTGQSGPILLYAPNSGGSGDSKNQSTLNRLSCNGALNVFCATQIDAVAQAILKLYPAPNANNGKTYNNLVENIGTQQNTVQWDQRLDWNISARDQTFLRYSYLNQPATNTLPLGPILDGSAFGAGRVSNHAENVAFSETHIFSPKLANEFRFGYSWGIFAFLQANSTTDVSSQLGLGGVPFGPGFPSNGGLPQGTLSGSTGLTSWGSAGYNPTTESQNVYQILDNVSKSFGRHSMRFGVAFQAIRFAANQPQASRGSYTYSGLYTSNVAGPTNTGSSVADFLANQMNSTTISNESAFNDSQWYRSAYFQDDWRLVPSLTINLGLRYDYYQPYKENDGLQANFVATSPLNIGSSTGIYVLPSRDSGTALPAKLTQLFQQNNVQIQYSNNPSLVNAQKLNFAPRLGFAEQVTPRLVIRGGFGLFYGGLQSEGGTNLGANPPFQVVSTVNPPSCHLANCPSNGITLETGLTTQLSQGIANFFSTPTLHAIDPNVKTPYTMDFNLAIERAITQNVVATVAYVGNVSRHLSDDNNYDYSPVLLNPSNSVQPYLAFPGFTNIFWINYIGISSYNSLQAKLESRASHGLNYLATYTYSHSLDDTTDAAGLESGVGGRNPRLIPVREEYTNSAWDQRHRLTLNGNYQLPFGVGRKYVNHAGILDEIVGGWSASLTFVAQTGQPFKVSPNITTATGGGTYRANLIRDPFKGGGTPDPSLGYTSGQTCPAKVRTRTNWYNPCAFANPLPGNLIPLLPSGATAAQAAAVGATTTAEAIAYQGGRGEQIHAPGYERVNMSLFKNFTTFRQQYLQFRADSFNLFNTPSWGKPSTATDAPTGGLITAPNTFQNNTPDARFFQLSAKYVF